MAQRAKRGEPAGRGAFGINLQFCGFDLRRIGKRRVDSVRLRLHRGIVEFDRARQVTRALAANHELCEAPRVMVNRVELCWRESSGRARVLEAALVPDTKQAAAQQDGVAMAIRCERDRDETIVRATVGNRGAEPVALDAVIFHVATGIAANHPARFFKHGYQSWSDSRPVRVGESRPHRRDGAVELIRLSHQSETTRPADAPEAATSEWFTIVEGDGRDERVLAGFIGGAAQLTALTVAAPDQIRARAMLDGVTLAPGAECEIEPLLLVRTAQPAARLAERWAARTGASMNARNAAAYQRGWCSWYHYFHGITEEALRANLKALAAARAEFPLELVQLDDGFQSALGDWDTTNAKFPSGLKRIADEIRAAGFAAGIWTAPFWLRAIRGS